MAERKYFKPRSVTWWASVVPIVAGVFIALDQIHGLADWSAAVSEMAGGASPAVLINAGLAGIGLRGAVK